MRPEGERSLIVAVDDQPEVRRLLADIFQVRQKELRGFGSGDQAVSFVREHAAHIELVILDLDLGRGKPSGIEVCRELRTTLRELPIILLTGHGTVDDTVAAIKAGADDVIAKDPYLEDKLDLSVEKIERMMAHVRERRRLEGENRELRAINARLRRISGQRWQIVGASEPLSKVMAKVERVAPVPRPVLVLGERGTGKELVARAIHHLSPRSNQPFVTINCAAVPESLLESELFGHEEGAFTGATKRKEGKFELADGGTLFLDEIGNMSMEFQAKILRVLEYQRFERVAGAASIQVDVRVIAATNADVRAQMQRGAFRRDLYDRLAFEVIHLPPLRERMDDVPALAAYFLSQFREDVAGVRVDEISADALDRLAAYDYPGNVRELKNVVERALYMASSAILGAEDIESALPPERSDATEAATALAGFRDDPALPLSERVDAFERALCKDALERTRYNQKEAAALLGLTYDQFRQRYRKYGLRKE
ncbi:sigma-54-dependent transcriptional regulator [Haliangium ochraceum]|uniref:Two component, sigma54 specific, transcriptional regulator, Fis family n=1 Tax=Haliangium ochraceum (strain DSM 14365 / JCM 11303 / SMP-2) TaxID=502025 RepID=D0LIJ2_HALO1|nr:sigma-54 dependent transcriptional regulator [Haliangium ochraceum]ACY18348.1 two component, sigma54 specific, transcriptional regulator, Fis family [Haliangium ochraceum DSM 14365]